MYITSVGIWNSLNLSASKFILNDQKEIDLAWSNTLFFFLALDLKYIHLIMHNGFA